MRSKKAFTLVELLVVIAVIALLLAILIPALRKAQEQAMRAVCGGNIGQHQLGLIVYADEHDGRLPVQQGGYWIWDVSYYLSVEMLKNMGIDTSQYDLQPDEDVPTQAVFYCPANQQQKRFRDVYWHYGLNYDETKGYWVINNRGGMYRVTGYLFLWWGPWSRNPGEPGAIEIYTGETEKSYLRRLDVKQPADAELVLDVVMSDRRPSAWPRDEYPDGNFAQILCGGMPGAGSPDSTSHLVNERKAAGGNIGFADGHIEWRAFVDMNMRVGVGGCPTFWW